jgi:hypothetical protein
LSLQLSLSYIINKIFINYFLTILFRTSVLTFQSFIFSLQLLFIIGSIFGIITPLSYENALNNKILLIGLAIFISLIILGIILIKLNIDWSKISLLYSIFPIVGSFIFLSFGTAHTIVEYGINDLSLITLGSMIICTVESKPFFSSWHLYYLKYSKDQ